MKFVIFGLTISSSWGNGHATIWRGLCRALAARGHGIVFFERDVYYYAEHRDYAGMNGLRLCLYPDWQSVLPFAREHLSDADVAMITSYCPDGRAACEMVLASRAKLKVFHDLDTPVTLDRLSRGEDVSYIPEYGLGDFDLVLSYTGGESLKGLTAGLGAKNAFPLYGSVDPETHKPVSVSSFYRADMSYLGTYSEDRQGKLNSLFIETSRRLPDRRFLIGGSLYPPDFPWTENIYYIRHVPPPRHPQFYSSSLITLNITRGPMAGMGYCPSGRLFEAAACGVPVLSDNWEGLDKFFEPGTEILLAEDTGDSVNALLRSREELARIGRRARERALSEHTARHRAEELERLLWSNRPGEKNKELICGG